MGAAAGVLVLSDSSRLQKPKDLRVCCLDDNRPDPAFWLGSSTAEVHHGMVEERGRRDGRENGIILISAGAKIEAPCGSLKS